MAPLGEETTQPVAGGADPDCMKIAPMGPEAFVAQLPRSASTPSAPTTTASASGGEFRKALSALGREIDRGEVRVARALRARGDLGAAELIALQAGVYRYSEVVDLAAKLVDRAASAVRTTLQSGG